MSPDSRPSLTRRRLVGSALVAAAGLAGCVAPGATVSGTAEQSFEVESPTGFAVETRNGDVTARGVTAITGAKTVNGDVALSRLY